MKTSVAIGGPDGCAACRYFKDQGGFSPPFGVCRRRAPVLIPAAPRPARAYWPTVEGGDLCGEFERAWLPCEPEA